MHIRCSFASAGMHSRLKSLRRYKDEWMTSRRPSRRQGAIRSVLFGSCVCSMVCLAIATSARAQRLPVLGNDVPQGSPIPRIEPSVLPGVQPGIQVPAQAVPASVPNVSHPIQAVTVTGATAFPQNTLSKLTAGLVGPAVSQARIEAARVALVNLYREDGYVFTAVSAFISGTSLRFVVTEGHISDIRLEGDVGPVSAQIMRFLNHVKQSGPVRTAAIERWLLLAADIPGISIRSVLQPSPTEPGALVLVAQVSRKLVDALITADNRGFNRAGPEQMLATVDFNSFTSLGERTELSIYHTFNNTQTFGQASTEFFVGDSGLKLRIYGGAGDTTPSGPFRAIGYDGFTTIFGTQVSYPVIRERQQTLTVFANFDALESNIRTDTGVNGSPSRLSYDSTRVLRVGATYAIGDLLFGSDRNATNAALLRLSQGIPSFGASRSNSLDAPRTGENTSFTKVDAELSRSQALYHPWDNAEVDIVETIAGQYSQDVLPPAEQYFLGGSRFNRGYYSGQVTGDRALVNSVELQLNTPIALPSFVPEFDARAQAYIFYDYGEVWQSRRADSNHTLNSFGIGSRFSLTRNLELDVEGVRRLTKYPAGSGTTISAQTGEAVFWRAVLRY